MPAGRTRMAASGAGLVVILRHAGTQALPLKQALTAHPFQFSGRITADILENPIVTPDIHHPVTSQNCRRSAREFPCRCRTWPGCRWPGYLGCGKCRRYRCPFQQSLQAVEDHRPGVKKADVTRFCRSCSTQLPISTRRWISRTCPRSAMVSPRPVGWIRLNLTEPAPQAWSQVDQVLDFTDIARVQAHDHLRPETRLCEHFHTRHGFLKAARNPAKGIMALCRWPVDADRDMAEGAVLPKVLAISGVNRVPLVSMVNPRFFSLSRSTMRRKSGCSSGSPPVSLTDLKPRGMPSSRASLNRSKSR